MCQYHRWFARKRIAHTANVGGSEGGGPHNAAATEPVADFIHAFVQIGRFAGIFKKAHLVAAVGDVAEFYTHQSHEHSTVVEAFEKLHHFWYHDMVGRRIRYSGLFGVGLKVGVTNLHAYTTGYFATLPELISELLGHGRHQCA